MVTNVTVPMNFGIELRNSPTHSNLTLHTSAGKVKASSVILSFNSPVISHMTGTLHMTSVDMLEFGEQAVNLFVDAAYSGTSDGLNNELFRDVNKMSYVFKVNWLSARCNEFFEGMCAAVNTENYDELCSLFEEAVYVMEYSKTKNYLMDVIDKFDRLDCKQNFINQYLVEAERLSTFQLDAVLILAGNEVSFVVETLTTQLKHQFNAKGPQLSDAQKFLLDNANLGLCKQSNSLLFDQLFDVLDNLPEDMARWLYKLHRKSHHVIKPSPKAAAARQNIISNMYHKLDFNMSMDGLLTFISSSDDVSNILMALEAVETWYLVNATNYPSSTNLDFDGLKVNSILMNLIQNLKLRFNDKLPYSMRKLGLWAWAVNGKCIEDLSICAEEAEQCSYVEISCVNGCMKPLKLLSGEAKIRFHFRPPSINHCNLPGDCGFILRTVPSDGSLRQLELCTKEEDYRNELIHYHEQVRAENMHVYFKQDTGWYQYVYPLTWLHFLYSQNNATARDAYTRGENLTSQSRFCVLYNLNNVD